MRVRATEGGLVLAVESTSGRGDGEWPAGAGGPNEVGPWWLSPLRRKVSYRLFASIAGRERQARLVARR